jgi:hypothetical protein
MPALLPQTNYPEFLCTYHIYTTISPSLLILYLLRTYHAQQANKRHVFYTFYDDITVHYQYPTNSSDPIISRHSTIKTSPSNSSLYAEARVGVIHIWGDFSRAVLRTSIMSLLNGRAAVGDTHMHMQK